jgi:glycosyltransferase involved in cell wall biosynthesis
MAAQVPCVVTLSGIAHDYIRNEYNALVVPYTDSLSIEQSIRRILNDKNLSLQLTENALLDIRSFSVEVHTENLVQLYKTLP